MGEFYGSIQVRTDDRAPVLSAVEKLARRLKVPILVSPVLRGWIGAYPAGYGQDDRVSKLLSKRISEEMIHLIVHDGDSFFYCYYREGKVVDRYEWPHDSFASASAPKRRRRPSRPERIAHLLREPDRLGDLKELLAAPAGPRVRFACHLLERFATLLDIPNVAQSYEYLREADGEGVEGWGEFTHVPDLSEERGRQLAAAAEKARLTQRLRDGGVLRHVESRPGKFDGFACRPLYCPDGSNGFLVFWTDWHTVERRPLEHYRPPWQSPGEPTGIDLEPSVACLAQSPSGRYLAVGHSHGNASVRLWDLVERRLDREIGHDIAALWAGFSPDERQVITVGPQACRITRLDDGESIAGPTFERAKVAAVHPDGTLLVGTETNLLHVIDLSSGTLRKTLLVGIRAQIDEMQMFQRGILGHMLRSWNSPEARQQFEAHMRQLEEQARSEPSGEEQTAGIHRDPAEFRRKAEALLASTVQRYADLEASRPPKNGSETPAALAVSGDGRWLAMSTSRGVRVYEWDAVRGAADYLPEPVARFDSMRGPVGGETNYVNGVAWHTGAPGVIFGGMDGRIDYLDVTSGEYRVLCELPGRVDVAEAMRTAHLPGNEIIGGTAILGLSLSADGSSLACCVLPEIWSREVNRKPFELMIWDCAALLRQ